MLYRHQPAPSQVRHRCRNPRYGGTLKIPAANPRDALCRPICERAFYGCRCRVCEQLYTRKTRRRIVCSRAQCQSLFWRHPEDFLVPATPLASVDDLGKCLRRSVAAAEQNVDMQDFFRRTFRDGGTEGSA
jgi:hypothetical protein